MPTRQSIIKILEQNIGNCVSGSDIAATLGISRNCVWKSIKKLQQEGYPIEAVTNNGYTLSTSSDIISAEGIGVFLNDSTLADRIQVFATLPSTIQTAKQQAAAGIAVPTIIIAEEQTQGKGRMGRQFYSPPKNGIYMSILLRPHLSIQDSTLVTTAAAVAVCRAIKATHGVSPGIKWVNDIVLRGKKVCGILTEAITNFEDGTIDYIIVGIGINVSTQDFPDEIKAVAGSVQTENDEKVTRNKLTASVINEFFSIFAELQGRAFMSEYRELSIAIGKEVEVIGHTQSYLAKVVNISDDGGLVIISNNGTTRTLMSGEISIKGDFYNDKIQTIHT